MHFHIALLQPYHAFPYYKLCRSILEIGPETFQDTSTKKKIEAAIKAQVANERSKMEKMYQALLKSMTEMELKMKEQKKELDIAQKELEVRLRAQ